MYMGLHGRPLGAVLLRDTKNSSNFGEKQRQTEQPMAFLGASCCVFYRFGARVFNLVVCVPNF